MNGSEPAAVGVQSEDRWPHPWVVTPAEAAVIQDRLRERVETTDRLPVLQHVAGVDVGFGAHGRVTCAAVVVLSYPALRVVDQAVACQPTTFPYVPGLLSFRELPAVLAAIERLNIRPDIYLCDGQGLAHPRRFGLACHLGVLLNVPAIGVAKSRLTGRHTEPPLEKGSWALLLDDGEVIGAVLRTRSLVKPVYVSVGHRVSLPTALRLTLACTTRYRLPEPTRQAHRLAAVAQKFHKNVTIGI